MWGNLRGWIIAAIMLLGTIGILYALTVARGESSARGLVPLAFKPIALPTDPGVILAAGTRDCDAGELYRRAIDEYLKTPNLYENAALDASPRHAVDLIVEAADCSHMHLFGLNPRQLINYDNRHEWIESLSALAHTTDDVGLRLRDNKPREARKYYEASLRLGQNLYNERITWPELTNALSILSESSRALAKLADLEHDTVRKESLTRFSGEVDDYHNTLQEQVASPLGNPVESFASTYAGDIFAVAKSSQADRLWRVEAILHIGRYRWNVADGHQGDQTWAPRELRKLQADPDPIIHLAVQQAQDLTVEQQRATGGGL